MNRRAVKVSGYRIEVLVFHNGEREVLGAIVRPGEYPKEAATRALKRVGYLRCWWSFDGTTNDGRDAWNVDYRASSGYHSARAVLPVHREAKAA